MQTALKPVIRSSGTRNASKDNTGICQEAMTFLAVSRQYRNVPMG
ncbi:MAG: hypothetical protein NW224_16500 [Leptolyngbyaceae cyanobacterium bins.302]|nr:hypothetical protein [Leptolyngbyaceae cyanobacterium bins.302]